MENLLSVLLKIIYFLFVFGLVVVLAYLASRILGRKVRYDAGKHMKIMDNLYMGNDRMLVIVQVGQEYLLLSSSSKGIQLIKTMESMPERITDDSGGPSGFREYFQRYRKNSRGKDDADE